MTSQIKYHIAGISGIPALINTINRKKLLVLTYHGIYDGPRRKDFLPPTFVHVDDFSLQLKFIKKKYKIIDPDILLKSLIKKEPLPSHSALITFDDGYESFFRLAAPVLNALDIRPIVFIPTRYVEERIPFWFDFFWLFTQQFSASDIDIFLKIINRTEQQRQNISDSPAEFIGIMKRMRPKKRDEIFNNITRYMKDKLKDNSDIIDHFYCMDNKTIKKLSDNGTIFGGHTHTHTILSALNDFDAEREIKVNKRKIEKLLGRPCNFFAFPNGGNADYNSKHKELLKLEGYRAAFSLTHSRSVVFNDVYEISRINVVPEDTVKSLLFRCVGMVSIIKKVKAFLP